MTPIAGAPPSRDCTSWVLTLSAPTISHVRRGRVRWGAEPEPQLPSPFPAAERTKGDLSFWSSAPLNHISPPALWLAWKFSQKGHQGRAVHLMPPVPRVSEPWAPGAGPGSWEPRLSQSSPRRAVDEQGARSRCPRSTPVAATLGPFPTVTDNSGHSGLSCAAHLQNPERGN